MDGSRIINQKGTWVPTGSEGYAHRYFTSADDMRFALPYCKGRTAAIQAGGNIGAWPQWLSHKFDRVYTFEPDAVNFECLLLNAKSHNINAMNCALADHTKPVSLRRGKNIGGYSVVEDRKDINTPQPGDIPCAMIDQLRLPVCDLIVLDVEGFEVPALRGAKETIERCSPVIMLEERGHGIKKGRGDTFSDVLKMLPGYNVVKRVKHDVVLVR